MKIFAIVLIIGSGLFSLAFIVPSHYTPGSLQNKRNGHLIVSLQGDTVLPDTTLPDTIVVIHDTLINASTAAFLPDSITGWGSYASFLADVHDSVQLEVILYRNVPDSSAWYIESYAGTIDSMFFPMKDQFFEHQEASRTWFIRIGIDGKFLIRQLSGNAPGNSFAILPIKLRYKRS